MDNEDIKNKLNEILEEKEEIRKIRQQIYQEILEQKTSRADILKTIKVGNVLKMNGFYFKVKKITKKDVL